MEDTKKTIRMIKDKVIRTIKYPKIPHRTVTDASVVLIKINKIHI